MIFKHSIVVFILLISMIGCAPKHGSDTYDGNEVNQISKIIQGTVVDIREVEIHGSNELGSSIGAGAGMAAGLSAGRSFEGNIIGAIIGAIIGSYIGSSIEEETTKGKGYEFLIRRDDTNEMISFVHRENKDNIQIGDTVTLTIGKTVRIAKKY